MPLKRARPRKAQRTHLPATIGAEATTEPKRLSSLTAPTAPKRGSFLSRSDRTSSCAFVMISALRSSVRTGCGWYITPVSGVVLSERL